jgi:histidine triad (HIT) family protein
VESFVDIADEDLHALSDAVAAVARRVMAVLLPGGLNVVQSTGSPATQTVAHLHVHVVPRTVGDGLPDLWPPPRDWPEAELDDIARALREERRTNHRRGEQ